MSKIWSSRMRNIKIEKITQTPIEKQEIEICERKGVGHPDSMADGFAESVSKALCNEYIKKFNTICHHNTDQVEVIGGRSVPKFGGGEIISPIYVLLTGRATKDFQGTEIPVDAVAIKAAKQYLETNLPEIKDIVIDCKIGCGSTDLRDVFKRGKVPIANDTSFGVGHAPFSELEQIVYLTETDIIKKYRLRHPEIGTDTKVMGLRKGDNIDLTIAAAIVDKHINDIVEYQDMIVGLSDEIYEKAQIYTDREISVDVNTADDYETESVYLTITGTSAEMGDDGSVGRGNRCNGLITPNRPMSMEATSGKNPINHVGKLYNLLSNQIANDIVENVNGIEEVYIRILSQIGKPIDQPFIASAQIIETGEIDIKEIKPDVEEIINYYLNDVTKVTDLLIKGEIKTF